MKFLQVKTNSYLKNFSHFNEEIVIHGKHPLIPHEISDSYRNLIEFCWDQNPDKRPKFIDIVNALKNDREFITSDINKDSFLNYVNEVDNNKDLTHMRHCKLRTKH